MLLKKTPISKKFFLQLVNKKINNALNDFNEKNMTNDELWYLKRSITKYLLDKEYYIKK